MLLPLGSSSAAGTHEHIAAALLVSHVVWIGGRCCAPAPIQSKARLP